MHLNLLLEASPNPFFDGMWRSPEDDTSLGYRSLRFWRQLVATAERGLFDAVVFDRTDAIPRIDPLMLLPALAASTTHIGLVTSPDKLAIPASTIAEQLGTLDQFTDGRAGWRVDGVEPHVIRQAVTAWETCWDHNAMVFDTRKNQMIHPDRVRSVVGADPHPCEPTRQRTPTLFAAADDPNGPAFGEVLLVDPVPVDEAPALVESTLDDVDAADRSFDEVTLTMTARIILGADDREVSQVKRHIDRYAGEGTSSSVPLVGTAGQVVAQMQAYLDAGFHGFNLVTTPLPSGVTLLADVLVPTLQDLGLLRERYESSTLREHYRGYGNNLLSVDHPARQS